MDTQTEWGSIGDWILLLLFLIAGFITWGIFLYPIWNVWAQKKKGEADLQEAYKNQQIQVAEAKARLEAAGLNKEAAIVEAEAVSEQVARIGKQLTSHDLYLKWQWIKMMEDKPENSVIYVPTEAGLPILEAGHRIKKQGMAKLAEAELKETEGGE